MISINDQIERAEQRWTAAGDYRNSFEVMTADLNEGKKADLLKLESRSRVQRRLESLGDIEGAEAIVEGPSFDFDPLERIIGANMLTGVSFLESGVLAARSVARVQIRNTQGIVAGFGSGVMVSPRLFMTNNHVLTDEALAANSFIEFGYLTSLLGPRQSLPFKLQPEIFFETDEELDFTLVAVEPVNAQGVDLSSRGWNALIAGSGKAVSGERVNIIQHPNGERMQLAIRDNQVIGPIDNFLLYKADTQPGSSGSPVFNDQWEMAALHHAGKPRRDAQGQILMRNGQRWTGLKQDVHRIDWIANEGVRISKIVEHVNGLNLSINRKQLWEQAFEAARTVDIWAKIEQECSHGENREQLIGQGSANSVQQDVDEYGNPSWLFRLSFGPVNAQQQLADPPSNTVPAIDSTHDSPIAKVTTVGGSVTGSGNVFSDAAEKILQKFSHTGVYYDSDDDKNAAASYWQDIDLQGNSASQFKAINNHLVGTHENVFSYSRARHEFLYPAIDLHPDGNLRSIYSGDNMSSVEVIAAELSKAASSSDSGVFETGVTELEGILDDEALWERLELESTQPPFNCEHVVPQSWFNKERVAKADLHHLFTCESRCNSFRSNIPYWQFSPTEEAVRERCGRTHKRIKFEPETGKGAAARATMYFLMRYPGIIGDVSKEMPKNRINVLLGWHQLHPVDEYERHRNWLIHKAQGNRNPFIDFPEIASAAILTRGFG